MKPLLFSFIAFLPFALGARYYFVCDTLHWCGRDSLVDARPVSLAVAMPDGRDRELRWPPYQRGEVSLPLSPVHQAGLDSLAVLAKAESDYVLRIEAPVSSAEGFGERVGRYADLGVARAAQIAEDLRTAGVPAERIELGTYRTAGRDVLVPRFSFQPIVPKTISDGMAEGEILADSMSLLGLRFESNSTALTPSAAFTDYAVSLVDALNAEPRLHLTLIGHTDNRSPSAHNDSLGFWRASAVATYLRQLGLRDTVSVETRGEREPAASNDTPEGRYLNRRVEARIQ